MRDRAAPGDRRLPEFGTAHFADADPLTRAYDKYTRLPAHLLVRADRIRSQLRRSLAEMFERFDLLAFPTVPAPAPPIAGPDRPAAVGPTRPTARTCARPASAT